MKRKLIRLRRFVSYIWRRLLRKPWQAELGVIDYNDGVITWKITAR